MADIVNLTVRLSEDGAAVTQASRETYTERIVRERAQAETEVRGMQAQAQREARAEQHRQWRAEQSVEEEQPNAEADRRRKGHGSGPPSGVQEVASEIPGFDSRILGAGGFAGAIAAATGAAVGFGLAVHKADRAIEDLARSRGIFGPAQAQAEQEKNLAADRVNIDRLAAREEFAARQAEQLRGVSGTGRLDPLRIWAIGQRLPLDEAIQGKPANLYSEFQDQGRPFFPSPRDLTSPEASRAEQAIGNFILNVYGSVVTESELRENVRDAVLQGFQQGFFTDHLSSALGVR